jgi:hypothetical protein
MAPFAGEGAGDEPLAWGQHEIFLAMTQQQSWFPLGGTNPLPPERTVEEVAAELSYLLGRYQTMRTRLRFAADGSPRQVVASTGEIALEVVDALDDDPAEVAELLRRRYAETDYSFVDEWPVRMGVVRSHGVLTHQVSIVCHLVTDSSGGAIMLQEVARRETAPVAGLSSLDQARWQQSPAGQRRNAAALRHWESQLRALTPPVVDASTDKRAPRHWQGEFTTPATQLAVRAIAERLRVDSGPIVLTLFAVALARVTGVNPVVLRPIASNRFQPGLADVVAYLAQNSLVVLDVGDQPFDAAVERTRKATLVAYKHAYFDPTQLNDLIARVSAERGVDVDVKCFFSDRRRAGGLAPTGPAPTPDQIRAALPRTTLRWVSEQDRPLEALMCYVNDHPDALQFEVFFDTHYLAPDDMARCFAELEAMAVEAATDPVATTRIAPAPATAVAPAPAHA